MGYQAKVLSGFSWQTALKVLFALLAMGKVAVLARLLTPQDFGIFSLVMIALGVTEAATQTGVNVTLLQTQESIKYYVSTAWVIAIIRGFLIGVVMLVFGAVLQRVYGEPSLFYLTAIASVVPVIKGFINPAIINLQKNFQFRADSVYQLSLRIVETVAAVFFVWWLGSVVGWLLGIIVAAGFEVVISFLFFRTRPDFIYSPGRAKVILQNAKGLALSSVLGYLNENADNMLIGRLAGTYALGLYQPTYSLTHEPTFEVAKSLHHGALPAMTRIATDKIRLKKAFIRSLLGVFFVTLVVSLPLFLLPNVLIPLVFGDKWSGAIELVRWLLFAGMIQAVFMVSHSLFLARNALKALNTHQALSFITMVIAIWFLTKSGGIYGAVIGLAVSRLVTLPILAWLVMKELRNKRE